MPFAATWQVLLLQQAPCLHYPRQLGCLYVPAKARKLPAWAAESVVKSLHRVLLDITGNNYHLQLSVSEVNGGKSALDGAPRSSEALYICDKFLRPRSSLHFCAPEGKTLWATVARLSLCAFKGISLSFAFLLLFVY